jgi:UDP-glucose 4-epimerase
MQVRSVLVTGVAGFLGRYIARYFFGQGQRVIGIDTVPPENAPLAELGAYYRLELPNPELQKVLQTHAPEVCIHCAGRASVGLSLTDPAADFQSGTLLTFEMLNALRLYAPTCRFIFLSSAAVYGDPKELPVHETYPSAPISPYGFHKWQCELVCMEFAKIYGLPTANVRIFSAYGPGLRRQVLWDICQKALTQNVIRLQGTGQESRDFIHALDIGKALSIIANVAPMQGEVYNLGSGYAVTIAELARIIIETLNLTCFPEFDGMNPVGVPLNWQADISKLNALGFTPSIPFEKGVRTFVNWCQAEIHGV